MFSISDDSNNTIQQLSSIEFIPDDKDAATQFKYVVGSDAELLDPFQHNNTVFEEQRSNQMIVTASNVSPKNEIQPIIYGGGRVEFNSTEFMQDKLNENEVIMHIADGQMFRKMQNVYVGQTVYSSELIPTNIPDDDVLPDISYLEQAGYHSNESAACASNEFPTNFGDTSTQSDQLLNQLIAEAEARLLFDDANDESKMLQELPAFVGNDQIQYSLQHQQSKNLMQMDRDHERMLMETAISPLREYYFNICSISIVFLIKRTTLNL